MKFAKLEKVVRPSCPKLRINGLPSSPPMMIFTPANVRYCTPNHTRPVLAEENPKASVGQRVELSGVGEFCAGGVDVSRCSARPERSSAGRAGR